MAIPYGLLEPVELTIPHLPRHLNGLRIAHISDLHIRHEVGAYHRLEAQLTSQRFDLVVLTGDYMNWAECDEEKRAAAVLGHLANQLRPRLGIFGVFGNHDTARLREQCQDIAVHWLSNEAYRLPDRPIEMLGLDMVAGEDPDSVVLAMSWARLKEAQEAQETQKTREPSNTVEAQMQRGREVLDRDERPLRLMLAHMSTALPVAAEFGVDVLISGHTHGGQCRLPTGHALINSTDLPLGLTSGVLRYRDTLAVVSRGIGWIGLAPRVFCKPHVPVYTLRRATMPGEYTQTIRNLRPW